MDFSVVVSPLTGTTISLTEVPDPVFAELMVGPGAAVDPLRAPQIAVAPITGRLVKLKAHAFLMLSEEGRGVLVHLGIDTVTLDGAGFELVAAEGDELLAGQAVVAWDPGLVEAGGLSPVCPVIALDAEVGDIDVVVGRRVVAG
ncbi:PTS glucose transporter subunit IIA, partial [Catenulispora yoronensis]|uniref:PTS sugar transporter subunit IIA n=1 Tax=Catenulispora yoronensis TaxID=450799 RepID=UPI0031D2EABD